MIFDAVGPEFGFHYDQNVESLNMDAQNFYDMLHAVQQSLWLGCNDYSELSIAVRLLNIKSKKNIS